MTQITITNIMTSLIYSWGLYFQDKVMASIFSYNHLYLLLCLPESIILLVHSICHRRDLWKIEPAKSERIVKAYKIISWDVLISITLVLLRLMTSAYFPGSKEIIGRNKIASFYSFIFCTHFIYGFNLISCYTEKYDA